VFQTLANRYSGMLAGRLQKPKPIQVLPSARPQVAENMFQAQAIQSGVSLKQPPASGGLQANNTQMNPMGSAIRNNMNNISTPVNKSQQGMKPVVAKNMFKSMFGG